MSLARRRASLLSRIGSACLDSRRRFWHASAATCQNSCEIPQTANGFRLISIEDEGLPLLGPGDGGWLVFLTGTGGHEAEFTVDRFEDREVDAAVLAEAVVDGLKEILRGGHVYFEHYDPMLGRLDPPWLRTSEE